MLPLRESTPSTWLSGYRRFWRGSQWEPFLQPAKGGFAVARTAPQAYICTNSMMDQPGVYELALVKKGSDRRYKVYVGQSSSLRRRFHNDYRGTSGSHLKAFFEEALKNGCDIWRRCRYMNTAEEAKKKEAQLLKKYDYAWNTRQAGCRARHIDIAVSQLCFNKSVTLLAKPAESVIESSSPLALGLKHLPHDVKSEVPITSKVPSKLTTSLGSPVRVSISASPYSPSIPSRTQRSWSDVPSLPRF